MISFAHRACATKGKPGKRSLLPCKHTERERSYVDVYSTEELIYAAVVHGYRYFFLELYIYEDADFILRNFMTRLAYFKIKHSPFPANVRTEEEKERYVTYINSRMNFMGILKRELSVTGSNGIDPSPEKRAFYKQVGSSF